jgi:hypothetical protein
MTHNLMEEIIMTMRIIQPDEAALAGLLTDRSDEAILHDALPRPRIIYPDSRI